MPGLRASTKLLKRMSKYKAGGAEFCGYSCKPGQREEAYVTKKKWQLNSTDRRQRNRYDLKASVAFLWKDSEGERYRGKGRLRDISESGVFVLTDMQPPEGVTVFLEVLFGPFRNGSAVAIDSQGEVIRIESADETGSHCGFAASTKTPKLRNQTMTAKSANQKDDAPLLMPDPKKMFPHD